MASVTASSTTTGGDSPPELLAARLRPLHLGVTEAGPAFQGTIRIHGAFGALLSQGKTGVVVGYSVENPVGNQVLESLNLRPRSLEIVSCPSCGRAQSRRLHPGQPDGLDVPLRVAVMRCVVNGPGT